MKRMEPFKLLVSQEDAEEIIMKRCLPVKDSETVDLSQASNRVLFSDIKAQQSVPPFNRSAMDGYAVIAEDTYGADEKEIILKLEGVVHAGEVSDITVNSGQCLQIATGSPMPKGANAVVMVEYTEETKNGILITKPVYPGANVSKKGEDIKKGDMILEGGSFLTPARIGTLAALGITDVEVYRKPKVAVIPTGKEIVPPDKPLKPGQIYDVNSFTLEAILNAHGAKVDRHPVVTDDYDKIRKAIEESLDYDMVVLSGGSSVGEKDLLVQVIEDVGEVLFHGVQIKPGKPTLFGVSNGTPIFGMPGYPTSCLSNAYIFLIPAIRQMAHLPQYTPRTLRAKLAKRIVSSSGRKQFLTVNISDGYVYPAYKHSGAITSMSQADGYIILPVNLDVIDENEEVEVCILE